MQGTEVNPAAVLRGDNIATKFQKLNDGSIQVIKTRTVKEVNFCPSSCEHIHLDHACYDTRFSTVILAPGNQE